jgi:predicted MFS family arabinose efflux permease
VPFRIFRIRNVIGADLIMMPVVAGMFSSFFFISLYTQKVLGYSPVKTGIGFLTVPICIAITATNIPRVVKRIGFKPILMVAPLLNACALFWFAHIRVQGNYWHDLFPGFVLLGLGMGATFVSITIAATSGVQPRESGLASGLLNTSQQVGGAIGLAILTGVATSAATRYVTHLATAPNALTPLAAKVHGYSAAFYVASGFMIGASVLATLLLKQSRGTAAESKAETTAVSVH